MVVDRCLIVDGLVVDCSCVFFVGWCFLVGGFGCSLYVVCRGSFLVVGWWFLVVVGCGLLSVGVSFFLLVVGRGLCDVGCCLFVVVLLCLFFCCSLFLARCVLLVACLSLVIDCWLSVARC